MRRLANIDNRAFAKFAVCLVMALVTLSSVGGFGADEPGPGTLNVAPAIFKKVGFDQHLGAAIPKDLTFRDETGKSVRIGDYLGKTPVVLGLVYYGCPNLCSLSIKGLLKSLQSNSLHLGSDYKVVLASIDPKEDSAYAAAQKRRFLKMVPVSSTDGNLFFLTGETANIQKLANAVGFRYEYDPASKQYAHAAGVVVLTPEGTISRYLFGIEYPPKDFRLAVVEASDGKVGNAVDQFLLFCYHYDPVQGRYGVFILNIIRVFAALSVLLLGWFIFVMARSNRRKVLQVP